MHVAGANLNAGRHLVSGSATLDRCQWDREYACRVGHIGPGSGPLDERGERLDSGGSCRIHLEQDDASLGRERGGAEVVSKTRCKAHGVVRNEIEPEDRVAALGGHHDRSAGITNRSGAQTKGSARDARLGSDFVGGLLPAAAKQAESARDEDESERHRDLGESAAAI